MARGLATIFGTEDDANSDFTSVVVAEFDYYGNQSDFDLGYIHNHTGAGSGGWGIEYLAATSNQETQGDIIWDPGGLYFHATYANFSTNSLVYATNNRNMVSTFCA